jgi:hypothetical protein
MNPTRYPLAWPVGWKRFKSIDRKSAPFRTKGRELSVFDGVSRVLQSLGRMGILEDDIVVSTNVRTRLDGLPRSSEPKPDDPGVAVYWQPATGSMRCMAIDRYNDVADNLAAIALTLDSMRAIERHGGGEILDRVYAGFTALPAPIVAGMKRDWSVVLGLQDLLLPKVEDVQAAYRRLAQQHHPDRGGDPAKMAELNAARDEALKEVGP